MYNNYLYKYFSRKPITFRFTKRYDFYKIKEKNFIIFLIVLYLENIESIHGPLFYTIKQVDTHMTHFDLIPVFIYNGNFGKS